MKRVVLWGISALVTGQFLLGCSKDEKSSNNSNLVTYNDVDIPIDETKEWPPELKSLAVAINADLPVDFDKITNILIGNHVAEFNKLEDESVELNDVLKNLSSLVATSKDLNLSDSKIAYETVIEESNGEKIQYNSAKVSLVHLLKQSRMQCYSGSMLNMVIKRKSGLGVDYRAGNYVMVYTEGHIFPGKMEFIPGTKDKNIAAQRDHWQLTGVETTAAGPASIAPVVSGNIPWNVLVFDAELVGLVEIFKNYLDPNQSSELAYQLRKITAEKYGISIPTKEESSEIASSMLSKTNRIQEGVESQLNSSPLAIGIVDIPEGDIERNDVEGVGAPSFVVLGSDRSQSSAFYGPEIFEPPFYEDPSESEGDDRGHRRGVPISLGENSKMGFAPILEKYSVNYCKPINPDVEHYDYYIKADNSGFQVVLCDGQNQSVFGSFLCFRDTIDESKMMEESSNDFISIEQSLNDQDQLIPSTHSYSKFLEDNKLSRGYYKNLSLLIKMNEKNRPYLSGHAEYSAGPTNSENQSASFDFECMLSEIKSEPPLNQKAPRRLGVKSFM